MPLPRFLLSLPLLLACWACGPTEVLVGDTPGVARVVAGVLDMEATDSLPREGAALEIPLGRPAGVALAEDGSFYFSDRTLRRLGWVSVQGHLSWVAGAGPTCGGPFPGPAAQPFLTCLADPATIALGADGAVIVVDYVGLRVYRYDPSDSTLRVVLGNGAAEMAADGAVARFAPVDGPFGVAVDPAGVVYVTERLAHRVLAIDLTGRVRVVAGTGVRGDAGDGGLATAARLDGPEGLAVAGDTLYISDSGNNRIRRVVHDTISSYAGIGAPGLRGDGAGVDQALFREPAGLARVGDLLFVVDRGNNRVRLIRTGPDSITTWGGTGAATSGPDRLEIGRTALAGPQGIAVAGRLVLVADSGGIVIRRVVR